MNLGCVGALPTLIVLGVASFAPPRAVQRPQLPAVQMSSTNDAALPSLCVLDLDDCLWTPEMFLLSEDVDVSNPILGDLGGRGEGVVGVRSGSSVIRLYPGAILALQECVDSLLHRGMRLAVASSANTPRAVEIGRQAMNVLEVLPGLTLFEVLRMGWDDEECVNLQVGRSPPLSSDKSRTHFPILRERTNIPYDEMVYLDDCNWSPHCEMVERNCPGVITQRTPNGLQEREWRAVLERYAAKVRAG